MNLPDLLWPPGGLTKRDHGHNIFAQISNKGRCLDIGIKQSKYFFFSYRTKGEGDRHYTICHKEDITPRKRHTDRKR